MKIIIYLYKLTDMNYVYIKKKLAVYFILHIPILY